MPKDITCKKNNNCVPTSNGAIRIENCLPEKNSTIAEMLIELLREPLIPRENIIHLILSGYDGYSAKKGERISLQ